MTEILSTYDIHQAIRDKENQFSLVVTDPSQPLQDRTEALFTLKRLFSLRRSLGLQGLYEDKFGNLRRTER